MLRRTIRRFAYAFALSLCAVAEADAQQPSPSPADALKPFQFLIGQWNITADLPGGGKAVLERTYRSVLGGKFIHRIDRASLRGTDAWTESWLGYDPARQGVAEWLFTENGAYALFHKVTIADEALQFEGKVVTGAGSGQVRYTIRKTGSNSFDETEEELRNGAWVADRSVKKFTRSSIASSASMPRAKEPAHAEARLLDVLAGNWRADGESDGAKYSVDYAFYWTLGGHFLRSDYSVTTNGQTEFHAASYSFFDPESKSLKQFGFSADGATLIAKVRADTGSVVFDGAMTNATRAVALRISYSRPDADTLSAGTEMQRADGTWRRTPAGAFKRRP